MCFFPAWFQFSPGLLRPRRFVVHQAAAQDRHPDVFLQLDIREKKQMSTLAMEVILLIKDLQPHWRLLASFVLTLPRHSPLWLNALLFPPISFPPRVAPRAPRAALGSRLSP